MISFVEKPKNVIKLVVTTGGKAAIEGVAKRYGMKEYVVAGKIYDWFIGQDDIFQRAVLGMLEGLEVDAARAFMERLAKGKGRTFRIIHTDLPTPPAAKAEPSGGSGESPDRGPPAGRQGKGRN